MKTTHGGSSNGGDGATGITQYASRERSNNTIEGSGRSGPRRRTSDGETIEETRSVNRYLRGNPVLGGWNIKGQGILGVG